MTANTTVLDVEKLRLARGFRLLFDDLSFTVASGDLLLLRGANGTGKSSLLRVLAGLLPPTSGAVNLSDNLMIRYLGHQDGLKGPMSVAENLKFLETLNSSDFTDNIKSLHLAPLMSLSVSDLSAGQRRRTALARMTAGDGALWLLDEPATSLDDTAKAWLWAQIAAHRAAGGAVIAAVHDKDTPADARTLQLGRAGKLGKAA